jgi:hypothetical protein
MVIKRTKMQIIQRLQQCQQAATGLQQLLLGGKWWKLLRTNRKTMYQRHQQQIVAGEWLQLFRLGGK